MLPNKRVSNIITPQYSYSSLLVLILPAVYLLSPSPLYGQGGRVPHPRQERRPETESLQAAATQHCAHTAGQGPPGKPAWCQQSPVTFPLLLQRCFLDAIPANGMTPFFW